jgi:hypothetical protein
MHAVMISISLWFAFTLHIASGKSCCAQVKLVTNANMPKSKTAVKTAILFELLAAQLLALSACLPVAL